MDTKFDLETLATEWNQMFTDLIEHKKHDPLVPYQPTPAYIKRSNKQPMLKLNIAAGPNIFPYDGWINYDHADFQSYFQYVQTIQSSQGMPEHQQKLWSYCRSGGKIDFRQQNMNDRFPHADNTVDAIYVGQAIEHLNPIHQTPNFLKECHRMLKPGGVLRMTTPDLDVLLDAYRANKMDQFIPDQPEYFKNACPSAKLAYLMYGAGGDKCTQQNYEGHFFLFTRTSMSHFLQQAGFSQIDFHYQTGKSHNPELAEEVVDEGLSHSFIVEAVK